MKRKKYNLDKQFAKLFRVSEKKPAFRLFIFLLKFNLLAIPMYIILMTGFQWTVLNQTTENIVFNMLITSGVPAEKVGTFITVPVEHGNFAGEIKSPSKSHNFKE